ncbi:MAG: acyl-ACP--UDP-N-acetylglucosamine O-acyltransferase [Acidobacteriota bacterium]
MTTKIHPTAIVDPDAKLADDVVVGPYAIIGPQVELGAGTQVDAGAQIHGPTRMGEGNRIFPYACVGFDPQDLKYGGEETWLYVGDRNQFREHCTVHRGTAKGGGETRVGSDNLFMVFTHIAHDCVVGDRTIFSNNGTLAGHVEVADDAVVGAFSSVHQFCRLGQHAYIGGYSVITRDALPFVKTVGVKPACYGLNRIGLERKGFTAERLDPLSAAYRILVRSKLNTAQAMERLREELADAADVAYIMDFVATSQRGVIKEMPQRTGQRGG